MAARHMERDMKHTKRRYIQLLKIELDDLKEDIGLVMEDYEAQRKRNAISQYVFLENMAVLKNEVLCVECAEHMLDQLDLERYASIEELVRDLEERFRRKMEEHGILAEVNRLIKRKLNKVARYVLGEPRPPEARS